MNTNLIAALAEELSLALDMDGECIGMSFHGSNVPEVHIKGDVASLSESYDVNARDSEDYPIEHAVVIDGVRHFSLHEAGENIANETQTGGSHDRTDQ